MKSISISISVTNKSGRGNATAAAIPPEHTHKLGHTPSLSCTSSPRMLSSCPPHPSRHDGLYLLAGARHISHGLGPRLRHEHVVFDAHAPEGHVGEDSVRYQEAGLGGVLQGGET